MVVSSISCRLGAFNNSSIISLPKLPIHYFNKGFLFQIVSCVGKALFVVTATAFGSCPSMARVCVEIDLIKSFPSRIWIGNGDHELFL